MNLKAKLLSALLLASMITGVMASCAKENNTASDLEDTSADTAANTEAVTEPIKTSGLEDTDWDGRKFTFISRDSSYGGWESLDIYAEAEDGEPINDAVYRRNRLVEDRYNIEIAEQKRSEVGSNVSKLVQAGDSTFDAVVCSGKDGTMLSNSLLLVDLYSVPNLDLQAEWWDQNAAKDFSIAKKLFMTVGDILISDKDGTWVMTFNKTMADNYKLDYPYQAVRDGLWTYDMMYDMAKTVTNDLDGDGTLDPNKDQIGIFTEAFDTYAAYFYSGARIFENVDDYPAYVLNNERGFNAFMDYFDIVKDTSVYAKGAYVNNTNTFIEGRALFRGTTLQSVRTFYRPFEDDFGLLTVPKYDEEQDSYHHIVSIGGSASILCVPQTSPDLEFTGFVLQAIGFESTDTLLDSYLNIGFDGKYLRDDDSIEMMRMCIATRVFDLSIIYTEWGDWMMHLFGLNSSSNVDLASRYASTENAVRTAIQKTVDLYSAS